MVAACVHRRGYHLRHFSCRMCLPQDQPFPVQFFPERYALRTCFHILGKTSFFIPGAERLSGRFVVL